MEEILKIQIILGNRWMKLMSKAEKAKEQLKHVRGEDEIDERERAEMLYAFRELTRTLNPKNWGDTVKAEDIANALLHLNDLSKKEFLSNLTTGD